MKLYSTLFVVTIFWAFYSNSQCTDLSNAVDQGSLSFDGNSNIYQTTGTVTDLDFYTFNVSCGNTYSFDFCNNGGSSGSLWPDITILNGGSSVAFSSSGSSSCNSLTWTATYTGSATIFITDNSDGCSDSSPNWTAGAMAYNETTASISYTSVTCGSADAIVSAPAGGTFTFNPNPGDGSNIDATTGDITNGTPGATYNVDYTEAICGQTYSTSVTLIAADASFTLASTSCSSADATLAGTSGGTFSFNPVPTDGATIDPTTGNITSGIAATTYYVDYTVCGATTNEAVTLASGGDPSFNLNVTCGGASATITGDAGGVFSFNPIPSDGAQLSSSTGTVSNGTAGNTYNVQYTVCGTSSTESVTVLTDDCWTLNGDASYLNVAGENCIELTDEINNQTGCAWNGAQIDFSNNFSLSLDYYFGNNIGGADGNTFTFQPSASTACGQDGGQLGAGGLSNALSIEFDTYDNDNPSHIYDMACDHVAIETDGDHQNGPPAAGPACAKPGGGNIDDGGTYEVEIAWNATSQTLSVYFNGVWILDYTEDIINNVFGGQSAVYWGATSATGGLNNQQYFCPSTIVILPTELTSFTTTCSNEEEVITWTSDTERNVDYYQVEYTYDGFTFFPVGTVDAIGNTQEQHTYTLSVENNRKNHYYRLKIVDVNGSFENTEIIAGNNCSKNDLVKSIFANHGKLDIELSENGICQLISPLGQIISTQISSNDKLSFATESLSTGVYLISFTSNRGEQLIKKVYIAN